MHIVTAEGILGMQGVPNTMKGLQEGMGTGIAKGDRGLSMTSKEVVREFQADTGGGALDALMADKTEEGPGRTCRA